MMSSCRDLGLALLATLLLAGSVRGEAADAVVPLGASEALLRERFGAALREEAVTLPASPLEAMLPGGRVAPPNTDEGAPEPRDPLASQKRLVREAGAGKVARVEYELYLDRVYRIRWQLAERFEIPIMEAAVTHLTRELGNPVYDQTFEAKVGSPKAERRRTAWKQAAQLLELRQLRPLGGGPIYISLSDLAISQSIIDAEGVLMPEPETADSWWRKPQKAPGLSTAKQRAAVLAAIDEVIAATGIARSNEQTPPPQASQ